MKSRKFLGYVFVVLAIVLSFAIVGQIPFVFRTIFEFFFIFTGKLDPSQAGVAAGHFTYWAFHFAATIVLWKYGLRFTKKNST